MDLSKKSFIRLLRVCAVGRFGESLASNCKEIIKRVSLNKQPCQARAAPVNINSDKTFIYLFAVSFNKCGRTCSTIDDLYGQVCVPNKVKVNVKVFNLISGVNETRFSVQYQSCGCEWKLNESVCTLK